MINRKVYKGKLENIDAINYQQESSFHNSRYLTLQLEKGMILHRFLSFKHATKFTEYWIDDMTFKEIFNIFHSSNTFSMKYKKEVIKDSLFLLSGWYLDGWRSKNPYKNKIDQHKPFIGINWRLKITLKKNLVGHYGEIGNQQMFKNYNGPRTFPWEGKIEKMDESRSGIRTERMHQYVIPRFKNLPDQNDWAEITHFAHL